MSDHIESDLMKLIGGDNDDHGQVTMGLSSSYTWRHDPRHLLFSFSRYKFCAKMLAGKKTVYEAGCGDGMGVAILMQELDSYLGVDLEPALIEQCKAHYTNEENIDFVQMDLTKDSPGKTYDACICLDVIEHIEESCEEEFVKGLCDNIDEDGICIMGTPNLTAERYASKASKIAHINLKSADGMRELMSKFFKNVFIFSMNDEVIHTGYGDMSHYLMAVGVGKIAE